MRRVKINHGDKSCNLDVANYGGSYVLKNDIREVLELEKDHIIEGFVNQSDDIIFSNVFHEEAEDGMEYDLIVKINEPKKTTFAEPPTMESKHSVHSNSKFGMEDFNFKPLLE